MSGCKKVVRARAMQLVLLGSFLFLFSLFLACVGSDATAATMTPLLSFAGDGWLSPGEAGLGPGGAAQTFLGTGNNERGFAYNPTTGNLLLVSRASPGAGNAATIRVINGTTGAESSFIPLPIPPVITGGTFNASMIGVADDGAIYVSNLSSAAGTPFNVYRLANEASGPTVAHTATIPITGTGTPRLGDTFDVIGSGVNTRLVASGSGTDGYAVFSTLDGLSYTASYVNVPGDAVGDYRLGITFGATDNNVIGTQGAATAAANLIRFTTASPAALNATGTTADGFERPIDFAVINGVPVLATVEASNDALYEPRVRVYDATNPASLVLLADGLAATGPFTANANGVGQVKFGSISGSCATLYAMSTNSGIQAFELCGVPEPTSFGLLLVSALLLAVRRRSGTR